MKNYIKPILLYIAFDKNDAVKTSGLSGGEDGKDDIFSPIYRPTIN